MTFRTDLSNPSDRDGAPRLSGPSLHSPPILGPPTAGRTRGGSFAVSALAAEVLLGGGILAVWIVAIYAGLAWFRYLGRSERRSAPARAAPRPEAARGRRPVLRRVRA